MNKRKDRCVEIRIAENQGPRQIEWKTKTKQVNRN